ncbi:MULTISPECIES: DUF397 domain-containing protein [unclassified Streptomyces]|uniref:DUF397 domain-containing protein n=1 Tax=unclassified Streptomyces TaxID=2593676 RepID=UPI002E76BB43|nr:DUF397 domain-containing protein [Streptomyces sp. JV176]MEE1798839.1 DUF397 domain-containing protein [Streptomyces sp. JV176]
MPRYEWQKSSYSSEGGNCVNVAAAPDGTLRLRESDDPDVLLFLAPGQLGSLLIAIKADRLRDLPRP